MPIKKESLASNENICRSDHESIDRESVADSENEDDRALNDSELPFSTPKKIVKISPPPFIINNIDNIGKAIEFTVLPELSVSPLTTVSESNAPVPRRLSPSTIHSEDPIEVTLQARNTRPTTSEADIFIAENETDAIEVLVNFAQKRDKFKKPRYF